MNPKAILAACFTFSLVYAAAQTAVRPRDTLPTPLRKVNRVAMKPSMILLTGAIALALASPLAHGTTTRVDFSKCRVPANTPDAPPGTMATNVGTTSGDATGDLKAFVTAGSFAKLAPNVIFLTATYVIDAGPQSFRAHVVGRYDLNIGEAELRGVVSEGWNVGSRVLDTFHTTTAGCVAGRLTITPWLDDGKG